MLRRTLLAVSLLAMSLLPGCAALRAAQRPASDQAVARTPERIARGEYLAHHVMVCFECHNQWDDKAGAPDVEHLGAGGKFYGHESGLPGSVYTANLTADPRTGLGAWTDGEILRAIREGISRDGHALFPLMPYRNYRAMSDEDAYSIVAYLRTLPPVTNPVPARKLDFPVNLIVNLFPKPVDGPVPPPPIDQVGRGKYLVSMMSCADCHTQMKMGQPDMSMYLGGGFLMKEPGVRPEGVVTPNITPDKETGIGTWSDDQIKQAITMGRRPDGKTLRRPMPWMAYNALSSEDLDAVVAYLRTVPPVHHEVKNRW